MSKATATVRPIFKMFVSTNLKQVQPLKIGRPPPVMPISELPLLKLAAQVAVAELFLKFQPKFSNFSTNCFNPLRSLGL